MTEPTRRGAMQAGKNPTWTILALSMRTSDYITKAIKNNEI